MERKNSWQLAEVAGLESPYRFQHLLGRGSWQADGLRDEQLGEVLAGLGAEDAVLAIDETGFVKQGKQSQSERRGPLVPAPTRIPVHASGATWVLRVKG